MDIKYQNRERLYTIEDLENLFNRFYRIEKSCNREEGTGLGLAIVKTLVECHSGEINVTSSNEETEFEIKIPIY